MSRRRKVPLTAEDVVQDVTRRIIRPGLRKALEEDGGTWRPLYVYRDGDMWTVTRWARSPGYKPPSTEAAFRLDEVPEGARALVACLVDLLGEQAWMARCAKEVANGPIEEAATLRAIAAEGAVSRAEGYARPELDEIIDACIARGDRMRPKEWAATYKLSLRTVNRRIKAARAKK